MSSANNPPRKRSKSKSTTAVLVATVRAVHLRFHEAPIFQDTFALQMLPPFWNAVGTYRPLKWLVGDVILGVYRPVYPAIVLRSRYTEDQLLQAVEEGASQYVILGAGLDTFALRRKELEDRVQVFEVDHPTTQEMKRKRVLQANGSIPSNLTFVPVDFENDLLHEELTKAGFDSEKPTFFSWLGVTYYLTQEAIRETLNRIAATAAPGSRIVFDYKIAQHMMSAEWGALAEKMERFVKRLGEPMLTDFTPQTLRDLMSRQGYREVEMAPPDEQRRRYLGERTDFVPAEFFHFAHFVLEPPNEEASS